MTQRIKQIQFIMIVALQSLSSLEIDFYRPGSSKTLASVIGFVQFTIFAEH